MHALFAVHAWWRPISSTRSLPCRDYSVASCHDMHDRREKLSAVICWRENKDIIIIVIAMVAFFRERETSRVITAWVHGCMGACCSALSDTRAYCVKATQRLATRWQVLTLRHTQTAAPNTQSQLLQPRYDRCPTTMEIYRSPMHD